MQPSTCTAGRCRGHGTSCPGTLGQENPKSVGTPPGVRLGVGDRVVLAPTASYPKLKHDSKAETFSRHGGQRVEARALTQPRDPR